MRVFCVYVYSKEIVELKIHQAGKPPGQVASFSFGRFVDIFLSFCSACVCGCETRGEVGVSSTAAWSRTRRREIKDSPENTRTL